MLKGSWYTVWEKEKRVKMAGRFLAIWFRYLETDWHAVRDPVLRTTPFVLTARERGRKLVVAVNAVAQAEGIVVGMNLSDARAIVPALEAREEASGFADNILQKIAVWCIRYAPVVAVHAPDGIVIDGSGCAHLFGGEAAYLKGILQRFEAMGYAVQGAMADTVGAALAVARYAAEARVVAPGRQLEAILPLPSASLRLEAPVLEQLQKLGLHQVHQFIRMSRKALHRRFGDGLLLRIDQATGKEKEPLLPVVAPEPFSERLPCLEPIRTRTGIELALTRLLESLCARLRKEQKGIRSVVLHCYRLDGKVLQVEVSTSRPTHSPAHLFQLFAFRLDGIQPDEGIELFTLSVARWEVLLPAQDMLWKGGGPGGVGHTALAELVDRIVVKLPDTAVLRCVPEENHLPEYAYRKVAFQEAAPGVWESHKCRPIQLLAVPEPVQVVSPVPDYPPMLFIRKGKRHKVVRADGPERLEQPWWMASGVHRDYYAVEDEEGCRYWLFREGHYDAAHKGQWFLHGFFA